MKVMKVLVLKVESQRVCGKYVNWKNKFQTQLVYAYIIYYAAIIKKQVLYKNNNCADHESI